MKKTLILVAITLSSCLSLPALAEEKTGVVKQLETESEGVYFVLTDDANTQYFIPTADNSAAATAVLVRSQEAGIKIGIKNVKQRKGNPDPHMKSATGVRLP